MDFGLARVVNENEQVREIMGTPEFVGKKWTMNNDLINGNFKLWSHKALPFSSKKPFK